MFNQIYNIFKYSKINFKFNLNAKILKSNISQSINTIYKQITQYINI